jgi:Leucine-rich repeat (LRR) protein
MTVKAVCLIFFVFRLLKPIQCDCKESYLVFCDCVSDLKNYKTANWTEVAIDSKSSCSSSSVSGYNFDCFDEIKLLFILNHVDNIKKGTFKTIGQTLKYLKFYGNNLHNIKISTFSGFRKLSYLTLINNNIESIESFAFKDSTIKNLDLSRNCLEVIPENAFQDCEITKITIRNNKLSLIHEKAFNKHVEVLHFDYNNIENIQSGFVSGLSRLKELTLSHNKLAHISGIMSLENVNKLDFSFNCINFIEMEEFEELKELTHLDLSGNKLERFPLRYFKKIKAERMTILLSYNLLTNIKIRDNVKPMTLTLYGNPWNCKCWQNVATHLIEDKFTTTKCDLELFKAGHVPVCIDQGECRSEPVQDRSTLRRFVKILREQMGQLGCDLFGQVGAKYVVSFI